MKVFNVFRAGIWKPRTRPNSFEGVGSIGLEWMKKVQNELGMMVSTEVANVKHVYEALRFWRRYYLDWSTYISKSFLRCKKLPML